MLVYKKKRKEIKPKTEKTPRQLERYFKGVANHRRIEILQLVAREEGINLANICETIGGNPKTVSEHTKKLVQAGLFNKSRKGQSVGHSLSPYGQRFLKFMKTF